MRERNCTKTILHGRSIFNESKKEKQKKKLKDKLIKKRGEKKIPTEGFVRGNNDNKDKTEKICKNYYLNEKQEN